MSMHEPSVAIVMIQWFIDPARVDEFLADQKTTRLRTPGFLGEMLYRATVDSEEPNDKAPVIFIDIQHWRSREDFYRKRSHLKPDVEPKRMPYEALPRRRHWLGPAE